MAVRHAADEYGSEGGVPDQQPLQGSGAGPMSVRASPEDFGAQVGEGLQRIGNAGQQVGGDIMNYAAYKQGLINEVVQTQTESKYLQEQSALTGQFKSLTGLAAQNALPQYQEDVQNLRAKYRDDLPVAAQRGFDMLAIRHEGYALSDANIYAAGQIKSAQRESALSLVNAATISSANPDVANNDYRFGTQLGDIAHHVLSTVDPLHPGLKTDPATGQISFDESKPEGAALKLDVNHQITSAQGQAWINRFDTLSKQDPMTAMDKFSSVKGEMPQFAQVQVQASLEPQVRNAQAVNTTNAVLGQARQDHSNQLFNPSSVGSSSYNLGNVKTPAGAANNTQDFVQPATPVEGVVLTANNLRSKTYAGKTLEQIGHTWTSTEPAAWIKNVSTSSGISPDTVPDLNDPQQLSALMKGIATAEKSPKDRALFTPDVINQGVQASLSGQKTSTAQAGAASSASAKPYGTNPDGSPITFADYATNNREAIYAYGDAYAEKAMRGDLEFRNAVRTRLTQQIDTAISDQKGAYKQDENQILRAFNGDFTKGTQPTSLEDLEAIPGMRDVVNRTRVHSPEFMHTMNNQLITSAAKGEDKDVKEGGADFHTWYDRSLLPEGDPNKPTQLDIMKAVGHGLTYSGMQKITSILDGKNAANEPYIKDAVDMAKSKILEALGPGPDSNDVISRATYKIRDEVTKGLANNKTIQQLVDPESKENVVLPIVKSIMPPDNNMERARQILNTDRSSWVPAGIPTPSRLIAHITGEDKLSDFEKNMHEAIQANSVSLPEAKTGLGEALRSGKISRDDAKRLYMQYGLDKVSQ